MLPVSVISVAGILESMGSIMKLCPRHCSGPTPVGCVTLEWAVAHEKKAVDICRSSLPGSNAIYNREVTEKGVRVRRDGGWCFLWALPTTMRRDSDTEPIVWSSLSGHNAKLERQSIFTIGNFDMAACRNLLYVWRIYLKCFVCFSLWLTKQTLVWASVCGLTWLCQAKAKVLTFWNA